MKAKGAQAYALDKDEGETLAAFGALIVVKAAADETSDRFGLIDETMPPGFETPYHVHHAEDEAFYVLEGEVTFVCDGRTIEGRPGTYVWGPRGVPHGFKVKGDQTARMLLLSIPAGFIDFTREVGAPVTDRSEPLPPMDIGKLMQVAPKYQIEILGPLPQ